ncbi:MAG TPA: MoxR family ATPase [Acidimicrobiales bacterium]|nr:MoxR family ATPase [Acidimicrobiales bacterium]
MPRSATATRPAARSRAASAGSTLDGPTFRKEFDEIVANVETVIKGKTDIVRLALIAILCEGHVLFEDLPGTGKSMLARALAESMQEASWQRVQCTPDMLPGDITGSAMLDQRSGNLEFRPGPVFTNVLLADEVNRATPKTQSALLEAMAERQVSADGVTYPLPRPFLVLATQNPIETAGTFPLPEAQLDRFLFKLSMGYLSREHELEVMFDNALSLSIEGITPVTTTARVQEMIRWAASTVEVSDQVGLYIVDLVQATRTDPAIVIGGSPRACIALLKAGKVMAASDGRTEVYPDDIRAVMSSVLAHRVVLHPDAILRGESVSVALDRVSNTIKPPVTGRR